MIQMQRPEIKCVELNVDTFYAKFEVEPLERGFGITLGNSLRRILLSSLPGYAINSIKIDGITHEFSTIPGVTEDVTEIILNLKEVCLKSDDLDDKKISIKAKGPCEVTAGDIITDSTIEVVNKDLHIAYVDENAELNIENGSKYVVTDINDNTVSLVNIENGDELKTSNFRKEDFANLDLGSNVIFKDNRFSLTNEEFEITNLNAKSKLDDLFFNIDEEEGSLFSVKKIDDDKIYLTNIQEGGYFSISKDKYPDFNVGDTLKKEHGKYILEQ